MIPTKEAKKIPFESFDDESKQYYYDLFKSYVVRKQIADTNKELISLFASKMKTNNPREYAKGFNSFNSYFANANLISKLSYDEINTSFLRKMTEDQFNYYLKRTGNDFYRKLALICYSTRPSERIANRLNFEAMQAYADMQYYVLNQLRDNLSLDSMLKNAASKTRKEFQQKHSYDYSQTPIAEKRTDYKSLAKKMSPIWKSMLNYYVKELTKINPNEASQFVLENFVFSAADRDFYLKTLENIPALANSEIEKQREIAVNNLENMPDYYNVGDYDEVFSKKFEEEMFEFAANSAVLSIFYKYLDDPIFKLENAKEKAL